MFERAAMGGSQPGPRAQVPKCVRYRVRGCSLTDSLDEKHATLIHFGWIRILSAGSRTEY